MRQHAAYFDNATQSYRVIAKDDDGYWFNTGITTDNIGEAKRVAEALNKEES